MKHSKLKVIAGVGALFIGSALSMNAIFAADSTTTPDSTTPTQDVRDGSWGHHNEDHPMNHDGHRGMHRNGNDDSMRPPEEAQQWRESRGERCHGNGRNSNGTHRGWNQ